jgi:hypothetical protein
LASSSASPEKIKKPSDKGTSKKDKKPKGAAEPTDPPIDTSKKDKKPKGAKPPKGAKLVKKINIKPKKIGGHPKTKKRYTNAHIHAYSNHHSYTRKKHIPNSIRANHKPVPQLHINHRRINTHRAIRRPRVYTKTRKYMRYKDTHFNKSVANKRHNRKSKSLKKQTKL